MGVFNKVKTEIVAIGGLVLIIVILSLVLIKFKSANPSNFLCNGKTVAAGAAEYFNSTGDVCCLGSASTVTNCFTGNTTAIASTGTGINNTVDYIDEPITWISIVIVAIVGIVLVKWFTKSKM